MLSKQQNKTPIKMKKYLLIAILTVCTLSFYSCEKFIIPIDEVGTVTFSEDIQPILVDKCSACHPDKAGLDLSEGKAYSSLLTHDGGNLINTDTPEDSPLYIRVKGGHGALITGEINKILKWIEQGAKND